LYKTVWLRDRKVSFSVSRINQYLNYYFIVFWVIVAIYVTSGFVAPLDWPRWMSSAYVPFAGILTLVGAVLLFGQTTNLDDGTLPKPDGSHGHRIKPGFARWPCRFLILEDDFHSISMVC
jgi:hypothetical protein